MNRPNDRSSSTVAVREPLEANGSKKPERQMSRRRRFAIQAISVCLGLVMSFVVLEFGLAAFYYSNEAEIERYVFDDELGWRFRPGQYIIKPPQSLLKHTISINTLGLRHQELGTPTEGTKRIIVLGDSFTFGENVNDKALFSTQLENRLNSNSGAGTKYEVVNTGVPGYGNAQELLLLRRLTGKGVVGQVYILNLFTNDILDDLCLNYSDRSRNLVQPGFVLDAGGHLVFQYKPQNTARGGDNLTAVRRGPSSKLFSVIKANLQSAAQTKPGLTKFASMIGYKINVQRMPGIINAWYDDEVLHQGVPLMKALIGEIDANVKSVNGKLVVCLIPSPMLVYKETYNQIIRTSFPDDPQAKQFLADPTRAQRIVRQLCAELNLPYLDMLDVLAPKKDQAFYLPTDGHFNEAGHAIFAASLETLVRDNAPQK
jgi:hypothetical protein